jgi:hypothetical protein
MMPSERFKTTLSDFEELMMLKYSDTLDSLSATKYKRHDGKMLTLFFYLDTYCGAWLGGEAWEYDAKEYLANKEVQADA